MKVPRRLKEIVSRHEGILIEHNKRGFMLKKPDGGQILVDLGQIVTLDQWRILASQVNQFARSE